MVRRALFALAFLTPFGAKLRAQRRTRLPNGKSRELLVAAHDHRESTADAAEIRDLADQLYAKFLDHGEHVNDLGDIRKAERIEKLAGRIKDRLNRRK